MSEIAIGAVEYLDRRWMDPGSTDPPASIPILLQQRRSVGCFTYPSPNWGQYSTPDDIVRERDLMIR